MNEVAIAALLCNLLNGGETELRHYFENLGENRHVRVDCETSSHVIEIGLDGSASSRDSVHQAIFFAFLTDKKPMVIMIDRDGVEDRWEYEMRVVTKELNIPYGRCKEAFIQSWAASAGLRVSSDKTFSDLPELSIAKRHCDLGGEFATSAGGALLVDLPSDKPPLFENDPAPARLDD